MTKRNENRSLPADSSASGPGNSPVATGVSRRTLLRQLGVIGAGAAFFSSPALAGVARPASGLGRGWIDVHHHMFPPFYMALRRKVPDVVEMPSWSPAKSLASMDENGVAMAMLSLAVTGVTFEPGEAGRKLARTSNDYGAKLVSQHPDRFGLLAALPLPDVQGSLAELEYACDKLHTNGIALLTSYGGKYQGDPSFTPVYEELNRRKAIVHVHPTVPLCCTDTLPNVPVSRLEFFFDTARAVYNLLLNGVYVRYPDIRFIFAHGGGATPSMAHRMAYYFPQKLLPTCAPHGVLYELRRQYYDTAGASNPTSLAGSTSLLPISQILFGTDFPFVPTRWTVDNLDLSSLSAADLEAIEWGNSVRLFDLHKA
ncbi:MAG TPA: amidohydrolase family protein [Patescibacteria group bacterium]|nr:amidohydrolase family protein [Patescibacteria group bacterium]